MQYPIFPFVLADYESPTLDMTVQSNYRRLDKPIACQLPQNEEKFKLHYEVRVY